MERAERRFLASDGNTCTTNTNTDLNLTTSCN